MKKKLKILIIFLISIIVVILYISFITNNNQNYLDSIAIKIKENYNIDEEITYSNFYNHYYIFTTKSRVIILNNEYQEVLNESIAIIQNKTENQELIYKNNKLMFEEVETKKNKINYKYYDATNGELIKETTMEKQ